MTGPRILAADLGGTKADLALYRVVDGELRAEREGRLPSAEYSGAGELLRAFAKQLPEPPQMVCAGIAGVVRGARAHPPNLPWTVDAGELAEACGAERALLINDLVATAHGVLALPPTGYAELQPGAADATGTVAVIAAGTGLGQAALVWDRGGYRAVPSEGGHAGFAPVGDEQVDLLQFLQAEFGRVSLERVLSGPGLHNIYRFLLQTRRSRPAPEVAARLAGEDPGTVIGELGVVNADPACARAVEVFCQIYGAAAGDLALSVLATGGVYLAGGVAQKLLEVLETGGFRRAFAAKGRLSPLLEAVPVRVVLAPRTAVYGAG
ncbi:MAG TPA: glucokinase, partial [Deferrisomatales bacterium]|nr:glucokinase [Deferrisomatales bacterium]